LAVEENAKNERLAAVARIGDSRPYAEEHGDGGLEDEPEAARALEPLGKVFQMVYSVFVTLHAS
jgi:hypothetical protein